MQPEENFSPTPLAPSISYAFWAKRRFAPQGAYYYPWRCCCKGVGAGGFQGGTGGKTLSLGGLEVVQ